MAEEPIKLTKLTRCAGCGAKVGAGVLAQLLEGIRAVGDDLWFGFPGVCSVGSPSVLIEGLSIAGK